MTYYEEDRPVYHTELSFYPIRCTILPKALNT